MGRLWKVDVKNPLNRDDETLYRLSHWYVGSEHGIHNRRYMFYEQENTKALNWQQEK